MYDFIGDIHGHADKLRLLLSRLGYTENQGVYQHPGRKVIFIGDYIDRGPKIPETLSIVRSMADAGSAIALMGNHEYNAICFNVKRKEGDFIRRHFIKHFLQHAETLRQFQNQQQQYDDYIEWFYTLPLFYEANTFRAVHACWDNKRINFLKKLLPGNRITPDLIRQTIDSPDLYQAIEETLKGKEVKLGSELSFLDKDGNRRNEIRIKWWEDARKHTYRTYSILEMEHLPDQPVHLAESSYYAENERPVFFGHYWLQGEPSLYRNNVCCLDYSVAKQGKLVAYSLDDEKELSDIKITFV